MSTTRTRSKNVNKTNFVHSEYALQSNGFVRICLTLVSLQYPSKSSLLKDVIFLNINLSKQENMSCIVATNKYCYGARNARQLWRKSITLGCCRVGSQKVPSTDTARHSGKCQECS